MRTPQDIQHEVVALTRVKAHVIDSDWFPGDSNHRAIDAQVKVLSFNLSMSALATNFGSSWHLYKHARDAYFWLNGVTDVAPSAAWSEMAVLA